MNDRTAASWRSVLAPTASGETAVALGVQLRQRESASEAHWGPRRVQPATPRSVATSDGELRLAVRPLSRSGASGRWVQGDETWESLRRGAWRVDAARARWFSTLYGIAHDARLLGGFGDSDWLTLDGADSELLWPHLRAAAGLGIPIVPTRPDQEIRLADAASVDVRVDDVAGALRLAAVVRVGDVVAERARPLGHVGVYAVEQVGDALHVVFAPAMLGVGIRALLAAGGPVTVPPDERREFFRDAYPRLAREATVVASAGVSLPAPERTTAVVAVEQRPRDELVYAIVWQVPGSGRVPWDERPDSDDGRGVLRGALEAAWSAVTDEPFLPSGQRSGVGAAEFTAEVLPALQRLDGVHVETSGVSRAYRELSGDPRITVRTVETTDADWFELGVHVEIEGRRIPFRPLFTALAQRRKKMLLSDGAYFALAHPALDRLRDLIEDSRDLVEWEAGSTRVSRYQLQLWTDFEDLADEAEPAARWRSSVEAMRSGGRTGGAEDFPGIRPPQGVVATLRPYQHDGLAWLSALHDARLGGILADDMGLGKTLQLLALLERAREAGETRPALVVAPTSVVSSWRDEAARHVPGMRVRVVDATGTRLDGLDADVVITSYAVLRLDAPSFAATTWSTLVLDEAQYVKNPRTRVHRAALDLRADVVFAATGTPLENSLVDLWAILSLTSPGLFPSARRFREEYVTPIERGRVDENLEGGPARERRLGRLRRRLRPFLLRRTKDIVAPELPPRQEQDVLVELSSGHRAVYERVLQRERRKVLGLLDDLDSQRFIVFRSLTLLRLLALAPGLVDAGGPGLVPSKLDALRGRLDAVIAEGHRALVFSQFTSFLDIVEADLRAAGIGVVRLDGSTTRRAEVVEAFRQGQDPVFLISLKAGGVGLTLTEADYVFLLDPWWNPAAEQQAIDRAHRIGQERPVTVYRLVAAGTIEEKVVDLQRRKARLIGAVLDDDGAFSTALTADDIRDLLA
ncbi:DEAD/DEAH box helicase [Microbacterium sp. cf332]|uniref:DEAD/DEAH box helicase n=1 Tax=Microbacterium sp. cf332 TaxID=1761804 RepID=UPI00088309F8|nr:DEAD/DEAH box helicase [Microbacterium sp. cf332]SDQ14737.1 Helicase conserved C-terminal domain-containing protein [Microbacterium sp. cf332]